LVAVLVLVLVAVLVVPGINDRAASAGTNDVRVWNSCRPPWPWHASGALRVHDAALPSPHPR